MKYVVGPLAAALFLSGLVLSAADPWDHGASHWNARDVQRVLRDSPWAHGTSANFGILEQIADDADTKQPDIPIGGQNAGLPGNDRSWDGGVGRARGGLPTLPLTIRWESALPVRQALDREQPSSNGGNAAAVRYQNDYAIALIGIWPGAKPPEKQLPDSAVLPKVEDPSAPKPNPPPDLGHMRQALMGAAHIVVPGKDPLTPEYVDLDPATGKITLYFPKNPALTIEDREATFTTRFGPMKLEQKFHLKDMVYQGKLAL
ncbi:MAG TPA: hypothetical protein VH325_14850 [Bryobacteraceae bacterium]|jgi:hypothetical protein|nr:hypothetical protein [Bryobacteraceae bacterium]